MTDGVRERILNRARVVVALGGRPTVEDFAAAAGVSRASFYRAFKSREQLLEALNRPPEPDSRERILDAALEMVGAQGLGSLSMEDLADRAGVSRATLYRLFPGKAALFTALMDAYSPLEPVVAILTAKQDQPPDVVMPEIALAVFRTIHGSGEDRTGLLRAVFFEVSRMAPDTEEATRDLVGRTVGLVAMYIAAQMEAGRLRRMHPLLALQLLIGPIFFHLMTRTTAQRVLGMEIDGEQAMRELTDGWLRAMSPKEENDE
ncbi:MAG TPA: helix-turn-helix domain-containing protein [Candidatus Dormibacteraeota bacterium]|nr:helix-turn-helix domain-containing protein [Candidatus Dormibacteraeota bacterium]